MNVFELTDTQRRFLTLVADRISLDRVVELHLFPPMRQGGSVETGVAVIAARPIAQPAAVSEAQDAAVASLSGEEPIIELPLDAEADDVVANADTAAEVHEAEVDERALEDEEVLEGDDIFVDEDEAEAAPIERFTVYTARYRLTVKGPDRGRWEADVVEEADAPLASIDEVVRGVQRRSPDGAEAEVERIDGEELRRLVGAT